MNHVVRGWPVDKAIILLAFVHSDRQITRILFWGVQMTHRITAVLFLMLSESV